MFNTIGFNMTRFNHTTIVYQYRACTHCHCVLYQRTIHMQLYGVGANHKSLWCGALPEGRHLLGPVLRLDVHKTSVLQAAAANHTNQIVPITPIRSIRSIRPIHRTNQSNRSYQSDQSDQSIVPVTPIRPIHRTNHTNQTNPSYRSHQSDQSIGTHVRGI